MAFATLRSRSTSWSRLLAMALCALLVVLVLGRSVHEISHVQESLPALADAQQAPETPSPLHGKLCAVCVALAHLAGGLPAALPISLAAASYLAPNPPSRADTTQNRLRAYDSRAPPA